MGPDAAGVGHADELGAHPHLGIAPRRQVPLHRAAEHVAYTELPADLAHGLGRSAIARGGAPGNDAQAADAGELSRDRLGDAVREVLAAEPPWFSNGRTTTRRSFADGWGPLRVRIALQATPSASAMPRMSAPARPQRCGATRPDASAGRALVAGTALVGVIPPLGVTIASSWGSARRRSASDRPALLQAPHHERRERGGRRRDAMLSGSGSWVTCAASISWAVRR